MKKFLVLFLVVGLSFIACQKENENLQCNDVEYGESFEIVKGNKYCFADGNYFIVDEMKNEFCPCNVKCAWEGEMILAYSTLENDKLVSKTVGSSDKTDSTFISSHHFIKFKEVVLTEPCSGSNPSPKIKSAVVIVRNE